MAQHTPLYHATAIAFCGYGFLLRGPAGAGKSDLALRLVQEGGVLIADDQTVLRAQGDLLFASCPEALKDTLEVRGIGLVHVPTTGFHPVHAIVRLISRDHLERIPEQTTETLEDVTLPAFALDPFMASALARFKLFTCILEDRSFVKTP